MVITDSAHARERIIDFLDASPDRVSAIPMAVDRARFTPEAGPRDDEVAISVGLPERFVFYPASLWPHKNHLALLRALALTPDDSLHLVLTGASFNRLRELMSVALSLGVADRVQHLGTVPGDTLPVLYRRAIALVFPSSYEGFGLPPLEAMACGCPVASSYAASLREVCGDAAARLDPDDPEQMADVLSRIACDNGFRDSLRLRGFQRARSFSWEAAACAHLEVYRRALDLSG